MSLRLAPTCATRRAIVLTSLMLSGHGFVHTSSAQVPAPSATLLEKLSAWELEQQVALQQATEKKRAEVAAILQQHLLEATKAGDTAAAQAIGKEIERLLPSNRPLRPAPPLSKPEAHPFPPDAVEFQGHHYRLYSELLTWEAASKACKKLKGNLALANSNEENAFLVELAAQHHASAVWLGSTDRKREDEWIAYDGTPLTFTNWEPGQPNNAHDVEHWAVLIIRSKRWWDYPEDPLEHPRLTGAGRPVYVCEWDE